MVARNIPVLMVAVALVIAACSSSDKTASVAHGDAIHFVATDSLYSAPDSIPSGMTHVAFENHGTHMHELMFIKLPDGMTREDYVAQVARGMDFPEGALDCSGVDLLSPGERAEAWLNLNPGNYILGCWFDDDLTSKPLHRVVVTADGHIASGPPRETATVRMIDYRFEISGPIPKGDAVLRVETAGPSMHEMDIYRLKDGRTLDDLRAWKKAETGAPPMRAMGGVLDSHDMSNVVWFKRSFEPGRYVLWCEMPMIHNAGKDAPHVTHADAGMYKEFEVSN
jgi:hypothetical protein